MSVESLEGRRFGPHRFTVCADKVAEFVAVTSGTSGLARGSNAAPPGFAAALLFAVAPDLLKDPAVGARFVVHGEQTFEWLAPLAIESSVEVTGEVTRVRARGDAAFVFFQLEATSNGVEVVTGRSTFVVGSSGEPLDERAIIPVDERGEDLSASRADLVRYAAATGDWNPIHWDHDSAVAAGLGGVVVHGLLQSAWLTNVAAAGADLAAARFRYPAMLRPGQSSTVIGDPDGGVFTLELVSDGVTSVSGQFTCR